MSASPLPSGLDASAGTKSSIGDSQDYYPQILTQHWPRIDQINVELESSTVNFAFFVDPWTFTSSSIVNVDLLPWTEEHG